MIDAGTVAEADELDAAKLKYDTVEEWVDEEGAFDDAAVTRGGVTVGTPVEDHGL